MSICCKKCGCCGELDCCGLEKFLDGHTQKCKYHQWYRKEILEDSKRLSLIYEKVYEWVNKQDQDKCWYYPDIFREICKILNISEFKEILPPRCEFEEGCRKYQEEIYDEQI